MLKSLVLGGGAPREKIWSGVVEWIEKGKTADQNKASRTVPCHITSNVKDGEPEMYVDWKASHMHWFDFIRIFASPPNKQ